MGAFRDTADTKSIIHFPSYSNQHVSCYGSKSFSDPLSLLHQISKPWWDKDSVFDKNKKKSHGVTSGDFGGHFINASSLVSQWTSPTALDRSHWSWWWSIDEMASEVSRHNAMRFFFMELHQRQSLPPTIASKSHAAERADHWNLCCHNKRHVNSSMRGNGYLPCHERFPYWISMR